jgi:hypothetical protein
LYAQIDYPVKVERFFEMFGDISLDFIPSLIDEDN